MKKQIALALACGLAAGPALAQHTVAIKNFRQILAYLADATGVPSTDADVKAVYDEVRTRLPRNGSVDEVSSPMLLALTSLAGMFCKKMIDRDAAIPDVTQRRAHRDVDFAAGPDSLTPEIRTSVAQEYAGLFWQRAATDGEAQKLVAVFAAAAQGGQSTPQETHTMLLMGCTAAATTLDALVQ